jgi:hypothetical protein
MLYEHLSDQAPVSYQRLHGDYSNYRFVGLFAMGSMVGEAYDSITNPFADVSPESLGKWCSQFPNAIEGVAEASIQLLSIEVQQPLLTETVQKKGCYAVYCYCEACHASITWSGIEPKVVESLLSLDYKDQSLISLYSKHRGFADILKEHVGSQKHCEVVNDSMGEALTSVMGITPGRAGRHMAYPRRGNDVVVKDVNPKCVGPATEQVFEKWPIGQPGTSGSGVCVAFPTKGVSCGTQGRHGVSVWCCPRQLLKGNVVSLDPIP